MPYVNDETLSLLACSIFILFGSSIGIVLAGYGVHEVSKMPFTLKPGCHDTNCTVNVIDGKCFARFLEFSDDGSEFKKVTCDKDRDGTYEVILPCDITKHGNPKINCNKENTGPRGGFGVLITALVLLGICFCGSAGFCFIGIGVAIESICKEMNKIKKEQMEMENRTKYKNQFSETNQNETPQFPKPYDLFGHFRIKESTTDSTSDSTTDSTSDSTTDSTSDSTTDSTNNKTDHENKITLSSNHSLHTSFIV